MLMITLFHAELLHLVEETQAGLELLILLRLLTGLQESRHTCFLLQELCNSCLE